VYPVAVAVKLNVPESFGVPDRVTELAVELMLSPAMEVALSETLVVPEVLLTVIDAPV
jgi:hypothetical protein